MSMYASATSVSVAKSKADIESLVGRYGASQFMSGWSGDRAAIGFVFANRQIKFELRLPERGDREFTHTDKGRLRKNPAAVEAAWEQACRTRWRALLLVIKGEARGGRGGHLDGRGGVHGLDGGAGHGGKTLGQRLLPQVAEAITSGKTPLLSLGG